MDYVTDHLTAPTQVMANELPSKSPPFFKRNLIKISRSIALKHIKYLCSSTGKWVKEWIFFFFLMFHYLTNINGGPKREKIQSTVESTKQQTGRIGTIFFPLVSFLNL